MPDGSYCNRTVRLTQSHTACTTAACTCYRVSHASLADVPATATTATVQFNYSAVTWTTGECCSVDSAVTETGTANVNITLNRYVHPSMSVKQQNMNKLSELFTVK